MRNAPVIVIEENGIRVDGLPLSSTAINEILNAVVHPDHRRWMRFERHNDIGIVHVKLEEQGPALKCATCHFFTTVKGFVHCPYDGIVLVSAPEMEVGNGKSSEGVGTYGQEAQDARNPSAAV